MTPSSYTLPGRECITPTICSEGCTRLLTGTTAEMILPTGESAAPARCGAPSAAASTTASSALRRWSRRQTVIERSPWVPGNHGGIAARDSAHTAGGILCQDRGAGCRQRKNRTNHRGTENTERTQDGSHEEYQSGLCFWFLAFVL